MKNLPAEKIRNWFGYTRRERRSSFILLIIIAVVAGLRFVLPASERNIEVITIEGFEVNADSSGDRMKPAGKQARTYVPASNRLRAAGVTELNTCDSAMLEALPGIGPVLSARIIRYRNLLGGYAEVGQLREVYGLSGEVFEIISGRLKADPALIRKININSSDYRQLIRLPYFDKNEVIAILKLREEKGRINSIDELIDNEIIQKDKAERVRWYLLF